MPLAKAQLALGAAGITVQKLGEAEVMAAAGIDDMLLTFNVVGAHKLERLAQLARRTSISVVTDSAAVAEGLGRAGEMAGRRIGVLVECDTGARRNGVQTPAAAAELARQVDATPGLAYGGLMTYPRPECATNAAPSLPKRATSRPGPGWRRARSRSAARPICGATRAWRRGWSIAPAPTLLRPIAG